MKNKTANNVKLVHKPPANPPKNRDGNRLIDRYLRIEDAVRRGDFESVDPAESNMLREELLILMRPLILNIRILLMLQLRDRQIRRILYRTLLNGSIEFAPITRRRAAKFLRSALIDGYLLLHRRAIPILPGYYDQSDKLALTAKQVKVPA